MALPGILTGAAGRAIDDLVRVRESAAGASHVFRTVADDGVTGGRATRAFDALEHFGTRDALRDAISAARPGLRSAFGARQAHVSGTMQAALGEVHSARSILATPHVAAERAVASARFGANAADRLVVTVDGAIPKLESAARRTAAARIALGTLGLGGTIAGVAALASRGEGGGQIIAPGPLHEPGAPDLSSRTYA